MDKEEVKTKDSFDSLTTLMTTEEE